MTSCSLLPQKLQWLLLFAFLAIGVFLFSYQHIIYHAIGLSFGCSHPEVTVGVTRYIFNRLAGVSGDDLVELLLDLCDLTCRDLDVGSLALNTTQRLVNHHARVGEGEPFLVTAGHEQYGRSLPLKHNGSEQYGGPLFWAHYSYLGLDPRGLEDRYADYWQNNVSHTLINRAWELRENITANDAMYVALAELLDAPLLTADATLARPPGSHAVVELLHEKLVD